MSAGNASGYRALVALDGLDDIDWASLTHAYGTATTIPDELRALLPGDERTRSEALALLAARICHQGSVYPATGPAVPFLVAIAASASLPSAFRAEIVQFLGFIAEGAVDLGRYHPDWAAEEWALTLSTNLHAAAPRLLDLLRESDGSLFRAWVVWFIHALPPSVRELDALRSVLDTERDEVVRATIALTLPPEDPVQRHLISGDQPGLVRLTAAAQLIALGRNLDDLVTIANESVPQSARFSEMPVRAEDTSPVRLIASRLGTVSPDRQDIWITLWLQDRDNCVEALYAAWGASEARRSSARSLVDPITQVLIRPPLQTKDFLGTSALSLVMLGLPGVYRLRELTSSLTGDALERVMFHLAAAEREISSVTWAAPATSPLRPPSELAAKLHDVRPLSHSELEALRALDELAQWGPRASDQVREIEKVLEEGKSASLRVHSAHALARITGEADRSVAVLLREFDARQARGVIVARFMGDLGPLAAGALPTLREYVNRDSRPLDVTALRDDLVTEACADAIARIQRQ